MVAAALAAAGCKSAPPVTQVSGSVVASDALNLSVSQRPSPLRLRIYELRAAASFNRADFMSLYQSDQAALAGDLVGREEIVLQPGESYPYNRQLGPETRFIGVIGLYRDLERATWRAISPVQPGRAQKLTIRADALAVSVSVQ